MSSLYNIILIYLFESGQMHNTVNTEYTNVNNVKRVKQTHDDKHNTKQDGS